MVRIREQVEGTYPPQLVPLLPKQPGVTRQCHRVAGDVHQLRRSECSQRVHHIRARTGTWRIEHHRAARKLGTLTFARGAQQLAQVAVHPRGVRGSTLPLTQVRFRKSSSNRIRFYRNQVRAITNRLGERGAKQADTAVQVEVTRGCIQQLGHKRFGYRSVQGRSRLTVHLPEPVLGEFELAVAHALTDSRTCARFLAIGNCAHPYLEIGRGDKIHACGSGGSTSDLLQCGLFDIGEGQWERIHPNHSVRASRIGANVPFRINVQGHPGAPSGTSPLIVAGCCEHLKGVELPGCNATEPGERIRQHLPLQFARNARQHVTEFRATRALLRSALDTCRIPYMRLSVFGWCQHSFGNRARKALMYLSDACDDPLTGKRVGHKDDAAVIEFADKHTTVGDTADREFDAITRADRVRCCAIHGVEPIGIGAHRSACR